MSVGELRYKERLLILDNYESVACRKVAEFLGDLANQCPKLWLLVTVCESTRIRDIELRLDLDRYPMSDQEAEALFVVRAQQVEGTSGLATQGGGAASGHSCRIECTYG